MGVSLPKVSFLRKILEILGVQSPAKWALVHSGANRAFVRWRYRDHIIEQDSHSLWTSGIRPETLQLPPPRTARLIGPQELSGED